MPRYEKLTCDEAQDEASIQNRKKTIGLIPYILLIVLILTLTVGVFYTRQGIQLKHREEATYHKQAATIQKNIVEMSEELLKLQSKREIDKKANEDKLNQLIQLNELLRTTRENKQAEVLMKENEFQKALDSLTKVNSDLEEQINDLITQHRLLRRKVKSKSKKLTQVHSKIIETEAELLLIEKWLNGRKIDTKCYFNTEEPNQAELFHANCDSDSKTLVLYKTRSFERFGGFVTKNWNGKQGVKDDNAFLFSLNNLELIPFNGKCPNGVLITSKSVLPSFGQSSSAYDILVEEKNGEISVRFGQLNCFGETEGETDTLLGFLQGNITLIEVYLVK